MLRREEGNGDEAAAASTAEGWTVGGGYPMPLPMADGEWYDTDGTLSESGSSSSSTGLYGSGSHDGEIEGGGYSDFTQEVWLDSEMMPSARNQYDELADAEEGPAWNMEYCSSIDDGTETGSWGGDSSPFDGEAPPYAEEVLIAGVTVAQLKAEASSLREPPRSGLLAPSQDLPMPTGPPKAVATAGATVNSGFGQQRVAEKTKKKSPGVCPLCSRAAYCDLQDAAHLNLDTTTPLDGKGRCKARDKPRKDNRLGLWYRKYGYDGLPYCKGCSESFKSHLIQQKTRPRCGCVRTAPCVDCTKVLSGFSGMSHSDVFDKFDAEKSSRADASIKNKVRVRKGTDSCNYSGADPPKRPRKALPAAGLAVVLISAIIWHSRSSTSFGQTPSADRVTRCVDDEDARAAANPFKDPQKPLSMSCHEIALNGQCDLELFVNLGVREFCCDSCNAVEPVWICPAAVIPEADDYSFDKAPGVEIPVNQGQGTETAATYQFCAAAPFSQTVPCSFMSTDKRSGELCFACTGAQALLHGASCEDAGPEGTIPYGWTCRCDGCVVAKSGSCVTQKVLQQDIYDFERAMATPRLADTSRPAQHAHVIGSGDQTPGASGIAGAGPANPPPTFVQPGSTDPAHGGGAVGPAFTYGGIEPPQGEIKMPGKSSTVAVSAPTLH
jgi:hypothetical protein